MLEKFNFKNVKWVENLHWRELEILNSIFNEPESREILEKAEKNRKTRKLFLIFWNIIIVFLSSFFAFSIKEVSDCKEIYDSPWRLEENQYISFRYENNRKIKELCTKREATLFDKLEMFAIVWLISILFYHRIISIFYNKKITKWIKWVILPNLCQKINKNLFYDTTWKYVFKDLDKLVSKRFLNSFDYIDYIEDSIYFNYDENWKKFFVNWFEFRSSKDQGSWKNRRRVTTNHCYLFKINFPNAKIPMKDNLFIKSIKNTKKYGYKNIFNIIPKLIFVVLTTIVLYFLLKTLDFNSSDFIIKGILLIGVFIITAVIIYFLSKINSTKRQKMENIEFEKLYNVYCNDEITSRMIVSPAFMDRVLKLNKDTWNIYSFFFTENILYLKMNLNRDFLEISIDKNMTTNLQTYFDFYIEIRNILRFFYEMNLFYLSKTKITPTSEEKNISKNDI